MKPKNFPGKKAIRQARASYRARLSSLEPEIAKLAKFEREPIAHPTVSDIRWRIGRDQRGPDGVGNAVRAAR